MHKTTCFIIKLIEFAELLSHEALNREIRDVKRRTGSYFISRVDMAESDSFISFSPPSIIDGKSDVYTSSSEYSDDEYVSGLSFGTEVHLYMLER